MTVWCFVTRLTRWVPLVEQELLTLPEHLSLPPDFSGVRVTRSVCVCFVDRCLSFSIFSFGHCVVCSSWNTTRIALNHNQSINQEKRNYIQLCLGRQSEEKHYNYYSKPYIKCQTIAFKGIKGWLYRTVCVSGYDTCLVCSFSNESISSDMKLYFRYNDKAYKTQITQCHTYWHDG